MNIPLPIPNITDKVKPLYFYDYVCLYIDINTLKLSAKYTIGSEFTVPIHRTENDTINLYHDIYNWYIRKKFVNMISFS